MIGRGPSPLVRGGVLPISDSSHCDTLGQQFVQQSLAFARTVPYKQLRSSCSVFAASSENIIFVTVSPSEGTVGWAEVVCEFSFFFAWKAKLFCFNSSAYGLLTLSWVWIARAHFATAVTAVESVVSKITVNPSTLFTCTQS